jgi:hypothetical protein
MAAWDRDPIVTPTQSAPAGGGAEAWRNDPVVQPKADAGPQSLGDQLSAGFTSGVKAIPFVGPQVLGGLEQLKAKVQGRTPEDVAATDQAQTEANPVASTIGDIAGPTLALAPLGLTATGARLLGMSGSLASRMIYGAASGGLIAGGDAAVRGQSPVDALESGGLGAGVGAALPGLGKVAGALLRGATGNAISRPVSQVAKALRREGITAPALRTRMAELGPEGMLADVGPNLTRQASTIASLPGEGQAIVRGRLSTRGGAAANQRVQDALDNTLGPAPILSLEKESIRAAQDALSPHYETALQHAQPVNAQPIAQDVAARAAVVRGDAQRALERLIPMFNTYGTNNVTASPRVLFEVRKAIDGMFEGDITSATRRELTAVRQQVDAELARAVPGIKQIDAQFEDLAHQSAALDRGGQVLGSGPDAPHPTDLAAEVATGSPGVRQRLSQGTRALLDRIVGNNANDVQALNRLIKGEGDWNRARLVTQFGQHRADQIIRAVQNELVFSRTNNIVQQGPETAARLHGGKELGEVNMEIPKNASWTGLGLNLATKGVNAALNAGKERTNARIAELLTGPMTPQVEAAISRALRPPRSGILPPAGASVAAEQHSEPLRIVVRGGR